MSLGGTGGTPNGENGAGGSIGTNDYSSNYGGAGGNSPFGTGGSSSLAMPNGTDGQGYGSGGGGASSPDRTSPYNWTGGTGASGLIVISWGGYVLPTVLPPPAVVETAQATGSGGGKIICTKLYQLGLMPENIYRADQQYGRQLHSTNPHGYEGYNRWAHTVVNWMDGKFKIKIPFMKKENSDSYLQCRAIKWAEDIATPWAQEMAYGFGEYPHSTALGRSLMKCGLAICDILGKKEQKTEIGIVGEYVLLGVFGIIKLIIFACKRK